MRRLGVSRGNPCKHMNIFQWHILIIACLASVAAALPGTFLVLNGVSLMSDAISHAILLGIAIMFMFVQRLDSPLLIVGACIAGLATVWLTQLLINTHRLKKDAAIGLVFPLFFSLGIIIISQYARNVHLDMDMVILGELAFAPFHRLVVWGHDLGPYALWLMGSIVCANIMFIWLFYKELKLATFDTTLAHVMGFYPTAIYYALMTMTSITAVGAFDIVGSIVIVALMITPPATAYLLTHSLSRMLTLSCIVGIMSTCTGYWCASWLDVSIAGSIATASGLFFLLALIFAPNKGLYAQWFVMRKEQSVIATNILCVYLLKNKAPIPASAVAPCFGWQPNYAQQIIRTCITQGTITLHNDYLTLTPSGYTQGTDNYSVDKHKH